MGDESDSTKKGEDIKKQVPGTGLSARAVQNKERRSSKIEAETIACKDEIKKFKENLLSSIAGTTSESILSSDEMMVPTQPRSRSASRARDSLIIPENVLAELDENKVFELKEAFLLFDMNGDGYIDNNDLRGTLVSLGEKVDEQAVRNMMSEASNPLDFDAFVNLLGYKTLDMDPEETLIEAMSRWDTNKSGLISEERFRKDLMTKGDKFTEKETDYALEEAPIIQKGNKIMIDYVQFCGQLSGLRKAKKAAQS